MSRATMFAWVGRWWRRRLRRIDAQVLAPAIREQARAPHLALAAALAHVEADPIWADASPKELNDFFADCSGSWGHR